MSPELVLKLGQAIGIYFQKQHERPKILIGKDTRRSGYMLEQALCSGMCSVGADALFLGPLPTPGIAYLTRGLRATAGIVISASHNPYYDNGIKIFGSDGFKLADSAELELEQMVLSLDLSKELPTGKDIGTARRIDDAIGQYAVFLKEQFPKHLTLEGVRIVLDTAHGASYRVAPKVFEELGAELFVIGNQPDGTNINHQVGALHPHELAEKVKLYKADIGLAFDGDADRLVVVDHRGEIVDGDEVLALSALHMMQEKKLNQNTLVATIMSNMGLDLALQKAGGKVFRTPVGDRYVMDAMRKGNFNLGGEQSGHIIFKDAATTGDGILAALKILEIVLERGRSVHDLKSGMTRMPQVLNSFEVKEKIAFENLPKFSAFLKDCETALEGVGRLVVRYSGTENKARVMAEGQDEKAVEVMVAELSQLLLREINETSQK
jgi:phosphoglucosamine mutase